MYINRGINNSKFKADMPRSQSHKKTISTLPKESRERVIEIEETPMDSNRYFQKSIQLESIRKNNFYNSSNYNSTRNSNINNRLSENFRDSKTFRNDNNNKIIKIEENFSSDNESSNNAHFNLKDKNFIYNKGFVKTKHNFSGSFSKSSYEKKNVPMAGPVKINNLNYVNKGPHKNKNYDDINNYIKNKILYPEAVNIKRVNFSKNKDVQNNTKNENNHNNTILTSLISNTVNTNINQNDTFDYEKNASEHISFSNVVKTNSDFNTVNISKDNDRNIGLIKDPVNMVFYFNNYILTNQSKATNDDNSVIIDNKNPNNIFLSEFEERNIKKKHTQGNIMKTRNEEKIANNPNHTKIKNINNFRKNYTTQLNPNQIQNRVEYNFKNESNKAILNDLTENYKNIPAPLNTKASKINGIKEPYNPLIRVKSNVAINESRYSKNLNEEDSFRYNKEGNVRQSLVNNSILRDLSMRNKTVSVLNSLEDLNSFRVDNKSLMQPQQLENSVMYDLTSKYSGISIKKIDYKTIKKQKYIDERKSENLNLFKIIENEKMSMRRFLKVDDLTFSNILSFCYDSIILMKSAYSRISDKIEINLNKYYYKIVQEFQNKFFLYFDLLEYFFSHNFNFPTLSLYIKFELRKGLLDIEPNTNSNALEKKTFVFSLFYKYKRNNEKYMISWKFDLTDKKNTHTWILSECQEFDKNIMRFCSLQPVLSFSKDDSIEIKIPIISRDGEINPNDFYWSDIKITEAPKNNFLDYEKKSPKSPDLPFDQLRYCELERVISAWKNEKNLSRKTLVNEFRIFFEDKFIIESIIYDASKYYIFKIKARANRVGKLEKNKYIKFDLEIVNEEETINNQIQSLGLLNFSDRIFQIRKNNLVYFYITELFSYDF